MEKFAYPIALAYCAENADMATQFKQGLQSVADFTDFVIVRDQRENLTSLLHGFDGPVFLLISDNFLRSTKCMEEGLMQLSEHQDGLLPIIIPGYRLDSDGQRVEIATSFERVSDIIQYINYWQERYLELRRQAKEDPDLSNEGFADHLRRVRAISSEAGEHIRLLRSLPYISLEDLQTKNYAPIFEFLDEEKLGEVFIENSTLTNIVNNQSSATSTTDTSVTIEDIDGTDDIPAELLAGIPGISLLPTTPEEEEEEEEEETAPEAIQEIATNEQNTTEANEVSVPPSEEALTVPQTATPPSNSLREQIEQAWKLADNEQTDEALTLLAQTLDIHPEEPELWYNQALLLAQTHKIREATHAINKVLQVTPEAENALFLAGELADVNEDGIRAKAYFGRLTELDPSNGEAWFQLGMVNTAYYPELVAESIQYLEKAATLATDSEPAYRLAMLYQNETDDQAQAIHYFQQTVALDPQHANAHYNLAVLQHQQGDYLPALDHYQQAVQLHPPFSTPENDAAFKLMAQKQQQEMENNTIKVLEEEVQALQQQLAQIDTTPAQQQERGVVLITGASSGIGKATARHFAAAGFRLIITGRRAERLQELKTEWEAQFPTQVHPLTFDVRDHAAAQAAIDNLPNDWAAIDILVNNAGKAKGFDPIHEGQLAHWDEMIDTNIKGLLYLTRAVSPGMVDRGRGHIINVASTAGKEVYPNGNVYCATKFAVDALTQGMRLDLHKHGVRVSQVAPAHVEETEFALVRFDGNSERAKIYEDFQPLTSRDVATTIFFIAEQPPHVNVLDVVVQGTQQASSTVIDRSGRDKYQVD